MLVTIALVISSCVVHLTCGATILNDAFANPNVTKAHFKDVLQGMEKLAHGLVKTTKVQKNLNKTLNNHKKSHRQSSTEFSKQLKHLENNDVKKNEELTHLKEEMHAMKKMISTLQSSFVQSVTQNSIMRKQLINLLDQNKKNDEQLTEMKSQIQLEQVRVQYLTHQLRMLTTTSNSLKTNVTKSFGHIHTQLSNFEKISEYVRNKTVKDIAVHNEVSRLQQDIISLQNEVYDVKVVVGLEKIEGLENNEGEPTSEDIELSVDEDDNTEEGFEEIPATTQTTIQKEIRRDGRNANERQTPTTALPTETQSWDNFNLFDIIKFNDKVQTNQNNPAESEKMKRFPNRMQMRNFPS